MSSVNGYVRVEFIHLIEEIDERGELIQIKWGRLKKYQNGG